MDSVRVNVLARRVRWDRNDSVVAPSSGRHGRRDVVAVAVVAWHVV